MYYYRQIQILKYDVQMLILGLSYFITTVAVIFVIKTNFRFRFMIFDDFFFSGHEAQTEVDKTTPWSETTKFRSDKATQFL